MIPAGRAAARVVVVGGGPAAVEALLALRGLAERRVELELIAPDSELVIRAYEVLAPFHKGRDHRYSLARIAGDLDAELVRDGLANVSADAQTVVLRSGAERRFDALIVAVGGHPTDTIAGAIPFRGARDASTLQSLLIDSGAGVHRRLTFVVPAGHGWPLPIYELALHTSVWLTERRVDSVPLTLVSAEPQPLAAFGTRVSLEVAALLRSHRVQFVAGHVVRLERGRLLLAGGRELDCDLAIESPRLGGPRIPGLAHDRDGFLPVDEAGRVRGAKRVFAAGDATTFPVKQGGLATQQADIVARHVAVEFGASVEAERFAPVLRAVLAGGRAPCYLYAELGDKLEETSNASVSPLWTEPGKLIGRYLAPYLDRLDRVDDAD